MQIGASAQESRTLSLLIEPPLKASTDCAGRFWMVLFEVVVWGRFRGKSLIRSAWSVRLVD